MKTVQVRVPGKILLAGEYAVLDGHASLSMALDSYLTVELTMKGDGGWVLHSDLWRAPRYLDQEPRVIAAQEPLLQVADFAKKHYALPHVECRIVSQFDIRHGLGSSSALRLGVLLGAHALAQGIVQLDTFTRVETARIAWRMQQEQQGFASGYDFLTQILGGWLHWQPDFANWPGSSINSLADQPLGELLTIMVGGQGAPTKTVGGSVRQAMAKQGLQQEFAAASDRLVDGWLGLIRQRDLVNSEIFAALQRHRSLLARLPHFPHKIFQRLAELPGFDQRWSAKTTGAGGEDAILVIGPKKETAPARAQLAQNGWHRLEADWTHNGAHIQAGDN